MQLIMDIDKPKERIHILQDKNKHAYLIMCHTNFHQLNILLELLDDARNDIYLHIDKKSNGFSAEQIQNHVSKAKIYFISPITVGWGGDSQIKAEVRLLREAVKSKHQYYHLISGVHFPLMSNDDLHQWFDACHGACILREVPLSEEEIQMRFGRYHFFLKHLISRNRFVNKTYHLGWRGALKLQKLLGIRRDTSFIQGKASQWCSLNEEAVSLLLAQEKTALKRFRRTFCCDEFFVRSVIEDTGIPILFDNRICHVEFVNTTPKQFTEADYPMLAASGALFFHLGLARIIERNFQSKSV